MVDAVALAATRGANQEPRNGNAVHGCAVVVGGAKGRDGTIQALDMLRAHASLGVEVVALAATQPQARMVGGQLALGRMLASQNENILRATTIMHCLVNQKTVTARIT